jgi:hypothetical protein
MRKSKEEVRRLAEKVRNDQQEKMDSLYRKNVKELGIPNTVYDPKAPALKNLWAVRRYARSIGVKGPLNKGSIVKWFQDIRNTTSHYHHHLHQVVVKIPETGKWATISNISWTSATKTYTNNQLVEAINQMPRRADGESYDAQRITSDSITEKRRHTARTITRAEANNMLNVPHFNARLNYIGWRKPQIPNVEESKMCGFKWLSEILEMGEAQTTEITGATRTSGITPFQIIECAKAVNKTTYVFDGLRNVVASFVVPINERTQASHRVAIVICHDHHYYDPEPSERNKLLRIADSYDVTKPVEKDEVKVNRKACEYKTHIFTEAEVNDAWALALSMSTAADKQERKNVAELKTAKTIAAAMHKINVKTTKDKQAQDINDMLGLPNCIAKQELRKVQKIEWVAMMAKRNADKSRHDAEIADALAFNASITDAPEVNIKHRIYVKADNLNGMYSAQIEKCNVYPITMSERDVSTIRVSKNVTIYANNDVEICAKTAAQLEIPFINQSVGQLASAVFAKTAADQWEKSIFNNHVEDLFNHRTFAGCNMQKQHFFEDNESVAAVDIVRNYTSIAEKGRFYTFGFTDNLVAYSEMDFIPGQCCMYYVDTTEDICFDGTGLYDFVVVEYGLRTGLITHANITHKIVGKLSTANDEVLRRFIDTVYAKISVDKCRKLAVNLTIGRFGSTLRTKQHKTIVASDWSTMVYCKNTMRADSSGVQRIVNGDNEPITIDGEAVWAVSSKETERTWGNDKPIRTAIVQRARMDTHRYAMAIERKGYKIVKIKTDAVYYVSVNKKTIKLVTKPKRGQLRVEWVRDQEVAKMECMMPVSTPPPSLTFEHVDAKWTFDNIENAHKDFDPSELLTHKRAYVDGPAGTGKTHVLNAVKVMCEAQHMKVASLSFTHAAADILNNGSTIHSMFAISINGVASKKITDAVFDNFDVFLIDECSMIPDNCWYVLSKIPDSKRVYGAGDFKQLERIEDGRSDITPADQTNEFKAIFGYRQHRLRKQHRSNAKYANQCAKLWETSFDTLPDGVKAGRIKQELLPDINICATNEKRRELNNMRINAHTTTTPTPLSERVLTPFDRRNDRRYAVEIFDIAKAEHILANRKQYQELLTNPRSANAADCMVVFEKYVANSKNGEKEVEYFRNNSAGRQMPEGSQGLANITRQIRHTIAGDLYHDVDIVNCHPVILNQLCKKHKIATPNLERVVNDREALFAELINPFSGREAVKKMILAIMNGGEHDMRKYTTNTPSAWVSAFFAECQKIHTHFASTATPFEMSNHLERRRGKGKQDTTDNASYTNKLMVDVEALMLESITRTLTGMKMLGSRDNRFVWCADGIMIEKDGQPLELSMLKTIEDNIFKETTYIAHLSVKPMTQGFVMPSVLDKYESKLSMINERQYDEFPKLYKKMPVIATKNTDMYHNNEYYTVTGFADKGFTHMTINGAVVEGDKATRASKKARKMAYVTMKKEWAARGIARITKKHQPQFLKEVEESIVCTAVDSLDAGLFVILEKGSKTLTMTNAAFRKHFKPRYATTVHKAQGRSFLGRVAVHEFNRMTKNGQYVALTRATAGENIQIIRKISD